ncbi:MAG: winged helix-turn-helix transcriptional regulator [Peptoniphilus harei]|uniref:carbohydrate kinase n=1 Tax=Peptoniphilus TaxID=162289 RepID=UPI0008DB2575|nr:MULTISPECIES: carbohydrate kinase [Peptoniphilus]MBS6611260.1 winged helix-turn-helix transcriptional regulator [Peptoniphilus harei]MDU1955369.1 carbohydrate kinase [Peptoniphilus lacydonensis]MDU2116113.1 carbohydrate kinase [Peptoniphilus lacydonensis]MDU5594972.1 carbohydrate kinase [Peptoniphilus rhinitidis]
MTPREREIINLIKKNPRISQQEIADELNITRPGVSAHINNLVTSGYILGRGYILREDNYVAILGGCNMDITGYSFDILRGKDSNPGKIKYSSGGVGRNICENLTRLGVSTTFLSVLGKDDAGKNILSELNSLNVDVSKVLITEGITPHYLAILDESKDMYVAVSDMDLIKNIDKNYIDKNKKIIENAKFTIVDTNLEEETLNYLLTNIEGKFLIDGVSTRKVMKIKNLLDKIYFLKVNIYEAQALVGIETREIEKLGDSLLNEGLNSLVITNGSNGSYYFDKNFKTKKESKKVDVVSASGAGDAFMAGYSYGLYNNFETEKRLLSAECAARITLKSHNSCSRELNENNLKGEMHDE